MKDKLKDMVPISMNGLSKEVSRVITEIKAEFINYFSMNKNLNDETLTQIDALNTKLDYINQKLDDFNDMDRFQAIAKSLSRLNYLDKLNGLDEISSKLEKLDKIDETLSKLEGLDKLKSLDKIDDFATKLNNLEKLDALDDFDQIIAKIDKLNKLDKLDKLDKLSHKYDDIYSKLESNGANLDILNNLQNNIKVNVNYTKNAADETLWAEIFNNAIQNSEWLKDTTFSPGRLAMGYPGLYAIYRTLTEFKPTSILEFGVGETTKMTGQYVQSNPNVDHQIVEHDVEWIDFFLENNPLDKRSNLVKLEKELVTYKRDDKVQVFRDFVETFQDMLFDFIVIDAPLGGDMKQYSRIDILSLLPGCLADDFVIVMDDFDRIGEKNTIKEMEILFLDHNITIHKGVYYGKKETIVITSNKLKFLTML